MFMFEEYIDYEFGDYSLTLFSVFGLHKFEYNYDRFVLYNNFFCESIGKINYSYIII